MSTFPRANTVWRRVANVAVVALAAPLLAALVPGVSGQAHAAAVCAPDPVLCPSTVSFEVSLPGNPRDLAGLQSFGSLTGKQPTVANYFAAFGDLLDGTGMTQLAAAQRLPMLTWSPSTAGNTGNPYPLTSIAAGTFDTYLTAQAHVLAAVPGPVVVRFAHEMNGSWFPWGRGVNGNTDADYVAAYRHVHDVVTAAGATNVIWVWAPGVSAGAADLSTLYPGDGYVDWVGLSVYFDHATDTFATLVAPVLAGIDSFAGSKPLFVAEMGVLPGANRPAQITDLVTGLLRTPRMVGLTWFEEPGRYDWRVSSDPASMAALAAALNTGWVTVPGQTTPQLPPLNQAGPVVTGTASVGGYLTATPGTWRSSPDTGGTAVLTGRWYRCPDAVTTATCTPVGGGTSASYMPQAYDWGTYLRYLATATNSAGSTSTFSAATGSIIVRPAAPTALTITSTSGGLMVTFPPAQYGTTHWQLTVNGKVYVPVPVGTATYWLTGLTNGTAYTVTLAAADITATDSRVSAALSASAVPMTRPSTPYVVITGPSAVFRMPSVIPAGASAWLLTLDGQTTSLPLTTSTWTAPDLTTGAAHTWTFAAAAGSGTGPGGWGSVGTPSTATFTPLDLPAMPAIAPSPGGATFTYAALPAGATGWQLTVGPTTYPVTSGPSTTVTGYATGLAPSWSLRAVNALTRSTSVTGRFTAG